LFRRLWERVTINSTSTLRKMLSCRALGSSEVHRCLVSFEVQPADRRATFPGWDIQVVVVVTMPHKGITMEINPGVVVGTKMASQANRMLRNVNIVYNPDLKLSV
jgi:hypothetical protein